MGQQLDVSATPCPACGERKLRIELRLEAKPVGSFSLAGVQTKFAASQWPYLICGACGVSARGEIDTVDGQLCHECGEDPAVATLVSQPAGTTVTARLCADCLELDVDRLAKQPDIAHTVIPDTT